MSDNTTIPTPNVPAFSSDDMKKFALFHSLRMRGANQADNDFYAAQSFELFMEEANWRHIRGTIK